jgi:hypothetical protein
MDFFHALLLEAFACYAAEHERLWREQTDEGERTAGKFGVCRGAQEKHSAFSIEECSHSSAAPMTSASRSSLRRSRVIASFSCSATSACLILSTRLLGKTASRRRATSSTSSSSALRLRNPSRYLAVVDEVMVAFRCELIRALVGTFTASSEGDRSRTRCHLMSRSTSSTQTA